MFKQILTRPDFDGLVCAVLLKQALGDHLPVRWVQPNQIQDGTYPVNQNDVVANLPINSRCGLWFDHHVSNEIDEPFEGLFRIAPSAAGLVFEFFRQTLDPRLQALVDQADKIDAALLTRDEIRYPEKYPYILLSMTIHTNRSSDLDYCDHLVALLGSRPIQAVMVDEWVRRRCDRVVEVNRAYETQLNNHTTVMAEISITDFRELKPVPDGNRFLVYSLFPHTIANIKIFHEGAMTVVKLGHSIVKRKCRVNVGRLLAAYGGGGHFGAGACRLPRETAEKSIAAIIATMVNNQPENP